MMIEVDLIEESKFDFIKPSIIEQYRKLFEQEMNVTSNISKEVTVTERDEDTWEMIEVIKQEPIVFDNINEEQHKIAANMFIYLNFQPSEEYLAWKKFLQEVLDTDFSNILLTLNRIYHTTKTRNIIVAEVTKNLIKTLKNYVTEDKGKKVLKIFFKFYFISLDSKLKSIINNHPVHISNDGPKSSSFIPFCDFGGETGVKMDTFSYPVCKEFQAKILNDQLCYEVDPNEFSNAKELTFLLDYNLDRQIEFDELVEINANSSLYMTLVDEEKRMSALIYLHTIGSLLKGIRILVFMYFLEPLKLFGEGDYNLYVVKENAATESFYSLDENTRRCKREEPYEHCTTRQYLNTVIEQCQCLPLSIWNSQNVFQRFLLKNATIFNPGLNLHFSRRVVLCHENLTRHFQVFTKL